MTEQEFMEELEIKGSLEIRTRHSYGERNEKSLGPWNRVNKIAVGMCIHQVFRE